MLRKLTALLLCMLLCIPVAVAEEGILPEIDSPQGESILPKLDVMTAVSFGVEMNVYPALTQTLETGEWQETYTSVTTQQYDEFGVILGLMGYTAEDVVQEGTRVSLTLCSGTLRIGFLYDYARHILTMTYPEGVLTGIEAVEPVTAIDHINQTVDTVESWLDEAYTLFTQNK